MPLHFSRWEVKQGIRITCQTPACTLYHVLKHLRSERPAQQACVLLHPSDFRAKAHA